MRVKTTSLHVFMLHQTVLSASDFSRPDMGPMNAMDVFCLIMIVLSSQPQQPPVFEHGPLMYSFLRQH